MTDFLLPDVRVKSLSPRLMDNTGRFVSPLSGTARTVSRPGDRWGIRIDYESLFGLERARIESFLANQRGAANRILVPMDKDFVARGSFPSAELFTNNNFATGLSPWTAESSMTVAAADRMLRSVRTVYDGTANNLTSPKSGAVTLAQYLPYCVRFLVRQGRGTAAGLLINNDVAADGFTGSSAVATVFQTVQSSAWGLIRGVRVPKTAGSYNFGPYNSAVSGGLAGDYYDTSWSSCAQCMLVDNSPNIMLDSDDFTNAVWGQHNATVTGNALVDPTGTSIADVLNEDATTNEHFLRQAVTVPATTLEYCAAVALKADGRNFAGVSLYEATGATYARGDFNLSTGALAGVNAGTNWSNVRQFIQPLGNGWFYCAVVALKTNAATSVGIKVEPETSAGTISYAGSNAAALGMFRGTVSQSSFPTALSQTAAAAFPTGILQTGNALNVKGLPASSSGLLLPGDWIEINLEPKRVIAELNSDGAGLGYLMFSPPIRNSPSDEDPVLVTAPMGRFIFSKNDTGWSSVPGPNASPFGSISMDLVETA